MCLNRFSLSFSFRFLIARSPKEKEITSEFSCRMEIKDGNLIKSFKWLRNKSEKLLLLHRMAEQAAATLFFSALNHVHSVGRAGGWYKLSLSFHCWRRATILWINEIGACDDLWFNPSHVCDHRLFISNDRTARISFSIEPEPPNASPCEIPIQQARRINRPLRHFTSFHFLNRPSRPSSSFMQFFCDNTTVSYSTCCFVMSFMAVPPLTHTPTHSHAS